MFFQVRSCSFIFVHFLSFSFIFFHFLSLSFIVFHFLAFSCIFFHFLAFSFIFFHFLSFSFIFFHFLSFSFIFFHFLCLCWVLKICFFLGLNFVTISLDNSYVKKQLILEPISVERGEEGGGASREGTPLGPLFLFFLLFSPVFCLFSCFLFFHFSLFLFISSFFDLLMFFHFSFFPKKKVSSFLFSCISCKYFLLLALVSEFNCFLRSRCSMEMWCPDDIGRDSWDWVGPPAWERACFNSAEWGWRLPRLFKTEPPQIVRIVVVLKKL